MELESGYSDLHRLFVNALLTKRIITLDEAISLLQKIVGLLGFRTRIEDKDITETIGEINAKISYLGMEIKEILSENDSSKHVVLVNIIDDSSVYHKVDHDYTLKERDAFRLLLHAIVTSEEHYGSISSMDALHLPVEGMRPGEIQDLIERFVLDEWFIETESGRIVPATRCIAEFGTYLKRNYEDVVQVCILCSNIVFYGVQCHCSAITHKHCFKIFNARRETQDFKCPTCKQQVLLNTGGATSASQAPQPRRRGPPSRSRLQEVPETPPDAPMEDDSDTSGESTPLTTRRGRKRHSRD